ncbi:dihydroxyacetone kinase subunit DhaK [Thermococcus barophilus]|uniref:Glycerone kinase n=1 Tax=Thermococcus barophilus TaxID=55802 RepID=A0A0S1XE13_THEBA|nr:dihydroxyacetone kinase subunit DhaK [Thermococcus barophilus]ALM76028.1 glycerone kinase [Thermococcus barophilus]
MKKLINKPEDVVKEMLEGMAAAHPDIIRVHFEPNFIYRADAPVKGKVALISGGGSGHEPLHGGYVGKGMLDAACPGNVFTSPTPDQMYEAGKTVEGGEGILLIVKNYTGDVMNFDMAAELLKGEGYKVESVVIADDVAVEESLYSAGRRGVGGTVFAEKIAGAAAEKGWPLEEVKKVAQKVAENVCSIGVALTPCTVPAAGKPTFELKEDEFEFGIGIHGEPGRRRLKMKPADEIVQMMMDAILKDMPLEKGDEVALLINGMGGTPLMELYIVNRKVSQILDTIGVKRYKTLVGNYITSLEMQGASITVLKLDEELKELLDYPVHTPAFRWGV